ncbi:hypothetical protein [Phytoactinopolyspora endophytica]|uniref:hypothetical protein n=1 Tax=Phytoactinopolyspora endophytica TaxID=1642495 RepID=UPI00101C7041|nr:hypothetical protein [Phytoactinopolyspora endophytica]
MGSLNLNATVYVTKNSREARGKCLTRLVPDLAAAGMRRLILERDEALLTFDRRTLADLVRQHCPELEYAHLKVHDDLLLTLPDAIAWCWAKGGRWRDQVEAYTHEVAL